MATATDWPTEKPFLENLRCKILFNEKCKILFDIHKSGYIETYKYILNAIGIGVVIELFYVPFQIHKINDRLDDLEN